MTSWSLTASGIRKRRCSFHFRYHATYNFLVALAFSQMFNLLCERADNVHGGRLPHHVRVLWDEAANTGQVPAAGKNLVAVIRSREISLTLFYQAVASARPFTIRTRRNDHGKHGQRGISSGGREASTIKEFLKTGWERPPSPCRPTGRSRGQSESYSQNITSGWAGS